MIAVHDRPEVSLLRRYSMVCCFGSAGGSRSAICGSEVSTPYSDGMKRFTPAEMAASMIETCLWVENVAIVDTTTSWFLKASRREGAE